MTTDQVAADSVRAQNAEALIPKEFVVHRDGERPFSFAGVCLAADTITTMAQERISAAVYRTAGGKFVATFSRESTLVKLSELMGIASEQRDPAEKPEKVRSFRKAQVFETIEEALAWYRPGRLTDSIRKKLGLDEPIRID